MANENETLLVLPLTSCYLLDVPVNSKECSDYSNNNITCVRCDVAGSFISGESINKIDSSGHRICLSLWIFQCFFGLIGIVASVLIMCILRRIFIRIAGGRGFDTLLFWLAAFDCLFCIFSIQSGTTCIVYFQNWSRTRSSVEAYRITIYTALFFRSCSTFTTVVIAIERFLVVTFPHMTRKKFSVNKARFLILCVIVLSLVIMFPRISSTYVSRNPFTSGIQSLKDLEYIIMATPIADFWFIKGILWHELVDFCLPLPLLLIFNSVVFCKLRKFDVQRDQLMPHQRKEMHRTKMFLPVAFVLLVCNCVPIIHTLFFVDGVVYRELGQAMLLSCTVNSSVNIAIYYVKGDSFRDETKAFFLVLRPSFMERKGESNTRDTSDFVNT